MSERVPPATTDRRRRAAVDAARRRLTQFAASHSLDELLEEMLGEAEALSGSVIGFFHLVEDDERSVTLQSWSRRTLAEFCRAEGRGRHYPVAEAGVWADCVRERRPVIQNDYAALPHRKGLPEEHARLVRELLVPVVRGERVTAILGVGNKATDYGPEDLEAVSLLADLAWELIERKRAERHLALLSFALNNVRESAFLIDARGAFQYVNDEACRQLGYRRDELLRRSVADVDPDFPASRWPAHWEELRAKRALIFEGRHRTGDGRILPVEISANYFEYEGEGYNLALAHDIGERKRSEEALRTSERRHRMAQSIGHVGNWEYDIVTTQFWGSDEAKRIYGFDPARPEFTTEEVEGCIPERERVHQALVDLIETGKPYDLTFEIHPRDASPPRVITSVADVQRDERGRPIAVMGVIQDVTEQRRAEEALKRSEERYRTLLQNLPVAVVVHGPDARILTCNARARELLGWPDEAALPEPTLDPSWSFLREDGSALPADEVPARRALATRSAVRNVVVGLRRPGAAVEEAPWLLLNADPVLEETGEVAQVIVTFIDITERRKMEAALRASEQSLALHVTQTPLGVIEWDLDFRALKWNPAAERIFGYTAAEALGQHASLIVPPGARDKVDEVWNALVSRRGGLRSTNENVTKDGRRIYCEWYNTPLVDAAGRVIAVASLVHDVTERERAVEALRERESFIRNVLDSVDEGFIVVDRELRILAANRAFCRATERPEGEVLGARCHEVSHGHPRPCWESGEDCAVQRTFATGAAQSASHVHVDRSGARRYVELKAFPITDASGAVISAIETVNDVTERRQLEERLRQSQKLEAIGTLAGGVAHDFNNILTGIIGYGNLVLAGMSPEDPLLPSVKEILAASDRAAQLTRGLLAFSRKQVLNPKPVDLNDVVRNVEKLLRRLIGEDVELTTTLAPGDLVVMADAGQLEQVLMNLATNARDAMPEGGRISIATRAIRLDEALARAKGLAKAGRCALVTVSDTGVGMDERTLEKLFEPFFTTKALGKGTGLGLAIVYGIVRQHGGAIEVTSEPGRGTTFRIVLPIVAPAPAEAVPPVLAPPAGGTETILLAEDDPTVRGLISTVLKGHGYAVIEAVDGADALEKFAAHRAEVDLLLLDVVMPRRSGREVYAAVRAERKELPALFVSGYTAEIIHKKGIFEEGLRFIAKPLSPFDLLRKVREVLDEQKGPPKR